MNGKYIQWNIIIEDDKATHSILNWLTGKTTFSQISTDCPIVKTELLRLTRRGATKAKQLSVNALRNRGYKITKNSSGNYDIRTP